MRLKVGLIQRMPEPYQGKPEITIPIFKSPGDYAGEPIGYIRVDNTQESREFLRQIASREVAFGCTFRTPTDIFGNKHTALNEVMAFHFMPTVEVMPVQSEHEIIVPLAPFPHGDNVKKLLYGKGDDAPVE